MTQESHKRHPNEELVKLYVPRSLKLELQALAASRNIALSALLRLVITEYVKSGK
jgi:hypothetical protein